jgi:hypothetical protein
MKIKLLLTLACGLALSLSVVHADILPLNAEVKFNFECRVDPVLNPNNFRLQTADIIKLIAKDQNIALPTGSRLWYGTNGQFLVTAQNGTTVLVEVDTNLLNLTQYNDIYTARSTSEPGRARTVITGNKIVAVNYQGSTVAFTVNVYGNYNSVMLTRGTNTTLDIQYNSTGFGPGVISGQSFNAFGNFTVNSP